MSQPGRRDKLIPNRNLTAPLRELVHQQGISLVLHGLAEIHSVPDAPKLPSSPKCPRNDRSRLSAVGYVAVMTLPPEKVEVMKRAVEGFQEKTFLSLISDVREFCRDHALVGGAITIRRLEDLGVGGPDHLIDVTPRIESSRHCPRQSGNLPVGSRRSPSTVSLASPLEARSCQRGSATACAALAGGYGQGWVR